MSVAFRAARRHHVPKRIITVPMRSAHMHILSTTNKFFLCFKTNCVCGGLMKHVTNKPPHNVWHLPSIKSLNAKMMF